MALQPSVHGGVKTNALDYITQSYVTIRSGSYQISGDTLIITAQIQVNAPVPSGTAAIAFANLPDGNWIRSSSGFPNNSNSSWNQIIIENGKLKFWGGTAGTVVDFCISTMKAY